MVRKPFPRLSKKKTGEVSIKDGVFKMEVKERWRFWVVIFTFFGIIFLAVAWLLPWLMLGLTWVYIIIVGVWTRFWRGIAWLKNKTVDGIKWTGTWCVVQPVRDFRYGRKKRKELEDRRTYAT